MPGLWFVASYSYLFLYGSILCLSLLLFFFLFGISCIFFFFFFFSSRRRHTRSLCDWSSDVCSSDLIDIYQRYSSGVVNITTSTIGYDFFLRPVPMESGTGSGAVIDDQGHIVTNFHVVRDAETLEVTLPDKSKHDAKVVGADPNNDLAVIQISGPHGRLTPVPLGTSKALHV